MMHVLRLWGVFCALYYTALGGMAFGGGVVLMDGEIGIGI